MDTDKPPSWASASAFAGRRRVAGIAWAAAQTGRGMRPGSKVQPAASPVATDCATSRWLIECRICTPPAAVLRWRCVDVGQSDECKKSEISGCIISRNFSLRTIEIGAETEL